MSMATGSRETAAWTDAAVGDARTLATRLGCESAEDEPLARHTSMGVGGPCRVMLWPRRADDVRALCRWMGSRGLPWRVLGGGSNLLVAADDYPGAVISTTRLIGGDEPEPEACTLAAGTPTKQALSRSVERGLDGLVWATGLPGTLGGAAAGNAGCWGGDMAGTVTHLDVVSADGEARRVPGEKLRWSYRDLDLAAAAGPDAVIVAVGVHLREADPEALRRRYEELSRLKRRRQPVGGRSSGCVFRNPDDERTAGQLIEAAGCKGLRIDGARVSEVHANFLINDGGATAAAVDRLIDEIRRRVRERFGIELQREVRRW
ncbi:MAG: UDP-N-acetylmuramate dehydrogenase [Acidobacteriota bacterium]